MAPTFHLICGPVGAGKTTYAMELADGLNAVRFSIDEWMVGLFGKDKPEPVQFDWVTERVERCEHQIGRLAIQCAQAGVAPVLDLSFLRARHRAAFADLAAESGFSAVLHFLDVPAGERWRRVAVRNDAQGKTFALSVSRWMFDFVEKIWEPPTPAEMQAYRGKHIRS